jgi:acetolactate synthase-1/2/3 large subunit
MTRTSPSSSPNPISTTARSTPATDFPSKNSAAKRLLQEAKRLGVKYLFVNLGSDHPAFIEAFAQLHQEGLEMPQIVICPHEMTALSAAHGYAMVHHEAQMVLVHVDVGTQNLGCSVSNASRSRVPCIIVAGLSPVTTNGSRLGARSEFIHYTQDAPRQSEIVSQYMKWCYELRAAEMIDEVLLRAKQIASSSPMGPVYLTASREVWEEPSTGPLREQAHWPAVQDLGMGAQEARDLVSVIAKSKRPLVLTSYLGRHPGAVHDLVALSDALGFAVCELNPHTMNFPGDHPHHLGYRRNTLIKDADLILMIDIDVPWIMSKVSPQPGCRFFFIDADPIKSNLGFWHFPSEKTWAANSALCLAQMRHEAGSLFLDHHQVLARKHWIQEAKATTAMPNLPTPADGCINIQQLSQAVKALVNERTVIVFEEPTATERLLETLKMSQPGSYYANGGSGLGWGINAAIGIKLASPSAEVITVVGDGSYLFGVPSSAFWVAETYGAPQLCIVFNNRGWGAPKVSTLLVHPEGVAKNTDHYWITVGAQAQFADIAHAASGAGAFRVEHIHQLQGALAQALALVRSGKSAVVDVVVLPVSSQVLGEP